MKGTGFARLMGLVMLSACLLAGCKLLSFSVDDPGALDWQVAAAPPVSTKSAGVTPVPLPQGYLGKDATVRFEEQADLDGDGTAERVRVCYQAGLRAGMYLSIGEAVAKLPPETPWNYICSFTDIDEGDEYRELGVYAEKKTFFYRYSEGTIYELGALPGCLPGQKGDTTLAIFPDGAGRVTLSGAQENTQVYEVENHRLVPLAKDQIS